jgi:hypothetical protein
MRMPRRPTSLNIRLNPRVRFCNPAFSTALWSYRQTRKPGADVSVLINSIRCASFPPPSVYLAQRKTDSRVTPASRAASVNLGFRTTSASTSHCPPPFIAGTALHTDGQRRVRS